MGLVWGVGGVATLLTLTPTGWIADNRDKLLVFRAIGLFCIVPVLLITNLPEGLSLPDRSAGDDAVHRGDVDPLGAADGDDYGQHRAAPARQFLERQFVGAADDDGRGTADG